MLKIIKNIINKNCKHKKISYNYEVISQHTNYEYQHCLKCHKNRKEDNMKVGEYVRTKDGIIDKVIIEYNGHCASRNCTCKHVSCERDYYDEEKIIKSSPNIIDLIEIGDYVNGIKITSIGNDDKGKYVFGYGADGMEGEMWFYNHEIKSIVTYEQFSQMQYKVGE